MVCFSRSIQQQKQVHNCKANDVDVVYNEQMKQNCLHGKAAELC